MRRVLKLTDNLIEAAVAPPVTVAYAKKHIKALTGSEDVLVETWIRAGGAMFEEATGRQPITATREVWLDTFPGLGLSGRRQRIELPRPPLQEVLSVKYLDGDGVLQSFTDYVVVAPSGDYCRPGFVEPSPGASWPGTADRSGAVQIRYKCGYGDGPEDLPPMVTGIVCFLVSQFDVYRTPVAEPRGILVQVPFGLQAMLDGFKYSAFPTDGPLYGEWTAADQTAGLA